MRSSSISKFLQERIDAGDFPSAVYLVAEKGEILLQDALGLAVVHPERIPASLDTIFDMASLTKPLVTGLLCGKLIEKGEIDLNDPISKYFPGFGTTEKKNITIRTLAAHISGLRSWRPFYLAKNAPSVSTNHHMGETNRAIKDFVLSEIARRPLVKATGAQVIYSDLNYILLGFLVEKIYGRDLNYILITEFFEKLGLFGTCFGGTKTLREEMAASEKGNEFEKQTSIQTGFISADSPEARTAFRKEQIWGEVHDGNAYFMGGVAGHAGLFSNAEETFKIAQQFLPNYTSLLLPETCELFRRDLTNGINEDRALGFQLASSPDTAAGPDLPSSSFGHLGFTGTSLWIDPVKKRVFILLTNRTHDHGLPFVNINSVRRQFHSLAVADLNGN